MCPAPPSPPLPFCSCLLHLLPSINLQFVSSFIWPHLVSVSSSLSYVTAALYQLTSRNIFIFPHPVYYWWVCFCFLILYYVSNFILIPFETWLTWSSGQNSIPLWWQQGVELIWYATLVTCYSQWFRIIPHPPVLCFDLSVLAVYLLNMSKDRNSHELI